jgi:predicted porin
MKRLALPLALALASLATTAHAQSSVTLYGVMDNAVQYLSGGIKGGGSMFSAESGGLFASRIGLRGSEDIGNGLHVNFALEDGINGMTGASSNPADMFSRQAWVGVSGAFGETRIGLQNTPQYIFINPELDPVAVMSMGSPMLNFNLLTIRTNNAISYFTPTIAGLTGQFMVAMRDSTTAPTNGLQFYNAALKYENGPFHLAAGYERQNTGAQLVEALNAGASVWIGAAKFYLAWQSGRESIAKNVKQNVIEASGSYKFGAADQLAIMYGFLNDRTGAGNNAQQIGLTYEHYLSKRTTLYASAGFIQNRNKAAFTLNGTSYQEPAGVPGADTRGAVVGMVHVF